MTLSRSLDCCGVVWRVSNVPPHRQAPPPPTFCTTVFYAASFSRLKGGVHLLEPCDELKCTPGIPEELGPRLGGFIVLEKGALTLRVAYSFANALYDVCEWRHCWRYPKSTQLSNTVCSVDADLSSQGIRGHSPQATGCYRPRTSSSGAPHRARITATASCSRPQRRYVRRGLARPRTSCRLRVGDSRQQSSVADG